MSLQIYLSIHLKARLISMCMKNYVVGRGDGLLPPRASHLSQSGIIKMKVVSGGLQRDPQIPKVQLLLVLRYSSFSSSSLYLRTLGPSPTAGLWSVDSKYGRRTLTFTRAVKMEPQLRRVNNPCDYFWLHFISYIT